MDRLSAHDAVMAASGMNGRDAIVAVLVILVVIWLLSPSPSKNKHTKGKNKGHRKHRVPHKQQQSKGKNGHKPRRKFGA